MTTPTQPQRWFDAYLAYLERKHRSRMLRQQLAQARAAGVAARQAARERRTT